MYVAHIVLEAGALENVFLGSVCSSSFLGSLKMLSLASCTKMLSRQEVPNCLGVGVIFVWNTRLLSAQRYSLATCARSLFQDL